MENLNYLVPYRTVRDGSLRMESLKNGNDETTSDSNREVWCVEEIIPGFPSAKNVSKTSPKILPNAIEKKFHFL